jgi:hypothetical protein
VARRMHDYGFTVGDCESVQGNFTKFIKLIELALEHGTSSFVFAACYAQYLESAHVGIHRVLLLPSKETNVQRMRERDPEDTQDIDYFFALAQQISEKEKIMTIVPHESECVDRTVVRICQAISTAEHTPHV